MKESHHLHHHHHHQPCQQQQLTSFQDWRGGGSVVVLAQCWPSCMKYLIHGWDPPGLPTPYSGPHWDISSENMAPTAPSTRHSILEFQIATSHPVSR